MLYYFSATKKQIKQFDSGSGIRMNGDMLELDPTLRRARKRGNGNIVAVSSYDLKGDVVEDKSGVVMAEFIPREAVLNVAPFQQLREIIAGGGILTRRKKGKLQVLLIFRRGVWDLPKGKKEVGESNKSCAIREVQEELGISDVSVVQSLGATMHGFSQNRFYRVKTTYWYEMRTTEKSFTPQASEGIEDVKWFKWKKAEKIIGYDSLRYFMNDVRELIEI